MDELSCRDLDEMLAAYAADALEPDDRAAAAAHLAECRYHDTALAGLRASFSALAAGAAPIEPPPSLRASLLDAFDREAAAPDTSESSTSPRAVPAGPMAAKRLTPVGWFGYAIAAALLLVAIGLGAWGASRDGDEGGIEVLTTQDGPATLQLTYLPAHGLGVIDVELPELDESQAYQAWRIDADGKAISLGVLPTTHGRVALDGDLRGATLVALSIESAGGSASPTGDAILVTALD
jgi:anti-sigma-K factor RskA